MVDDRRTLTAAEHAALEFLKAGPADLARTTEETVVRVVPRLWDAVNNTLAAARLADSTQASDRPVRRVRTVEAKAARRLAKAGLVVIDNGRASLAEVPE